MSPQEVLAASVIVAVCVLVQALTGSGFGILAAPLLLLTVPQLVPVPLLMITVLLMAMLLLLDRHGLRHRELGPALAWSVPGAVVGMLAGPSLSGRWTAIVVGALVVGSVAAALGGWVLPQTPRAVAAAGAVGGAMGSLAATPGPPVVLVYRTSDLVRYRANLALFFMVSSSVSLLSSVLTAATSGVQVLLALELVPGAVAGALAARSLRTRVPAHVVRPLALGLSLVAGLGLVARGLVGLVV